MQDPAYFLNCCECGIRFAMPQSLDSWLREDARRWFFCPRGHRQHYSNEANDIEKIRRERDRLKQNIAYEQDRVRHAQEAAERASASARGYKGAATRLKNRAKAGVCPCCNRTFQNLARHMATQHPDADLDKVVELGQPGKASA